MRLKAKRSIASVPKWALFTIGALVALCFTMFIFNAKRLVPYEAAWGNIGTWAQALLTGAGLVFTGLAVRVAARQLEDSRNQELRRSEETKEIARIGIILRSHWSERHNPGAVGKHVQYEYELANMSSFPITNCVILLHMLDDENEHLYPADIATTDDFFQSISVGTLAPGERASGALNVTNPKAAWGMWDRMANPALTFTDAWGRHWRRPQTTHLKPPAADLEELTANCLCCGKLPDRRSFSSQN